MTAYVYNNGLAVHRIVGGFEDGHTEYLKGWAITHLSSGMVLDNDCRTKKQAVAIVAEMERQSDASNFSFGIPFGDISNHWDEVRELYELIKQAKQSLIMQAGIFHP